MTRAQLDRPPRLSGFSEKPRAHRARRPPAAGGLLDQRRIPISRDRVLNLMRRMGQRATYQRTTVVFVPLMSALLSSPDRRSTSPDLIIVLKKQLGRSSYLRFSDVNYVDPTHRTHPSSGQAATGYLLGHSGSLPATQGQR
jgi:hypothetical protein